jgi:hypothetical protein
MSDAKCTLLRNVIPMLSFPMTLFVTDRNVSPNKPTSGVFYEYSFTNGEYRTQAPLSTPNDMKYKNMIFTYLLDTFRQTKQVMLPIDGMYLQGENGPIAFGNK